MIRVVCGSFLSGPDFWMLKLKIGLTGFKKNPEMFS
jgi:hypothetical protein